MKLSSRAEIIAVRTSAEGPQTTRPTQKGVGASTEQLPGDPYCAFAVYVPVDRSSKPHAGIHTTMLFPCVLSCLSMAFLFLEGQGVVLYYNNTEL